MGAADGHIPSILPYKILTTSPQQKLYTKFGLPNAQYQAVYCELWEVKKQFSWFPAKHFMVNKDFRKLLERAFVNLERAGCHTEIKTYDGCLSGRAVRGYSDTLSLHA